MDFSKLSTNQQLTVGAAVVALVSSFLPWYGVLGLNISAWSSGILAWGGVLLIVAAAAILIMASLDNAVGSNPNQLAFILSAVGLAFIVLRLITETNFLKFGIFLALIAAGAATWATYQNRTETS